MAQSNTAMQRNQQDPLAWLQGASRDPGAISERLQYAASHYHLVSPATVCAALPEGCAIVLSTVIVSEGDTYPVPGGGKLGLQKTALDKIAGALGIVWDPQLSGRQDDGRDPHYCCFRVVGTVRDLDGTVRTIQGTKEMDLRDGGAQATRVLESSRDQSKAVANLRDIRSFILGHAETKARLRAVRSLGVRTSYEREELKKPFVVAKLMFTGQSTDPELRRQFATMTATAMLGGARALYGGDLPAGGQVAARAAFAAPPVGASRYAQDHDDDGVVDHHPTPEPQRAAPPAPPPPAAPPRSQGGAPAASGVTMKFGKAKGVALSAASDRDLEWYAKAVEEGVNDPAKAQYRASGERHLAEVRAEQARREVGEPPADEGDDGNNPENW